MMNIREAHTSKGGREIGRKSVRERRRTGKREGGSRPRKYGRTCPSDAAREECNEVAGDVITAEPVFFSRFSRNKTERRECVRAERVKGRGSYMGTVTCMYVQEGAMRCRVTGVGLQGCDV